jgi:hypothetical protein
MNCDCGRRHFLRLSMVTLGAVGVAGIAGAALAAEPAPASGPKSAKVFICPPCGCDNDGKEFAAGGACSACDMPLMEKPAAAPKPGL